MNESSGAAPISCIGIILDGNRRWAKEHGLPTLEGHRRGMSVIREVALAAQHRGIKHLASFMFSTENWNREPAEVSYLMELLLWYLQKEVRVLGAAGIRVRFAGQRDKFSDAIQKAIVEAEKETAQNTGLTLWGCMSYGGRAEIVEAARAAAALGEEITEESIAHHLWTAEMPDPDLIIRTSGEQRLSGFLTWESVYSELFFTETKWPDFSEKEFDAILADYAQRERRRGK